MTTPSTSSECAKYAGGPWCSPSEHLLVKTKEAQLGKCQCLCVNKTALFEMSQPVQYIAHMGSRLPYYITEYVTKNERSEQDDMWHDIYTSTKTLASISQKHVILPLSITVAFSSIHARERCKETKRQWIARHYVMSTLNRGVNKAAAPHRLGLVFCKTHIAASDQRERVEDAMMVDDVNSVFFVNEDDDETFRWRTYINFRWQDENCNDNASNFVNVTKTTTKIGVFSSTRRWRQRKLSVRRKLFRQVRNLPTSVFRKHVMKDLRFMWFEPCQFVYSIRCKVQMAANCLGQRRRWRKFSLTNLFLFSLTRRKLWR